MNDAEVTQLALDLLRTDHADEVVSILRDRGLWDNPSLWRLYGDKEGNYAQVGNQQSRPEAALVEKIVNGIDARLMRECLLRGVDPESERAPVSIGDAVRSYFDGAGPSGSLVDWSTGDRSRESHLITVAATGDKPTQGRRTSNMCLTVVDQGEGQTPARLPQTILSLNAKNKQRIRFVQGKYNMGGSGALRFCAGGLQLVISRRDAQLGAGESEDPTRDAWAITIVRREEPSGKAGEPIHSEFTYLAPIGAYEHPREGNVLSFQAESLPLMPEGNQPYTREIAWGTAIKLYEFETSIGQSNILLADGLLYALERLLPKVALPIRLHECRKYAGKPGSFDTPLAGLVVRIEDGKREPLEPGFPLSVHVRCDRLEMGARIYAFKEDAPRYLQDEGVIFQINGQAHGHISKNIFSRPRAVGLQRLRDSVLVLVDCSSLSAVQREDLFMPSRDRLSRGPLRVRLEREIEALLKECTELRRLQQTRRERDIQDRLSEERPMEQVLSRVMKSSPALQSLFLRGQRLSRPFQKGGSGSGKEGEGAEPGPGVFRGRRHPTFFRIKGQPYGTTYRRTCEKGRRCRIDFETDAENLYFDRSAEPGVFNLQIVESGIDADEPNYSIRLADGIAHLNMHLPPDVQPRDELVLEASVSDPTLVEPFVNLIKIVVTPRHQRQPGSGEKRERKGSGSGEREVRSGIQLPNVVEVHEGDPLWVKHKFDPRTSCHVIADTVLIDGVEVVERTFYINVDNVALQTEMKYSKQDPRLLKAKFKYGNVLLGLGLLHHAESNGREPTDENDEPIEDRIRTYSTAVAPVLIPIIDELSGLNVEELDVVTGPSEDQ